MSKTPTSDQTRLDNIVEFPMPTSLSCLAVAGRHFGIHTSAAELVREYALSGEQGAADLSALADKLGLELGALQIAQANVADLAQVLPAIVRLSNGNAMLLLKLARTADGYAATLYDPTVGEAAPLTLEWERLAASTSEIMLVKPSSEERDDRTGSFGIGHVVAEVRREKRLFRDIALAAVLMSVTALAPALFWQLVVDRVLVYKSLSTLHVLVGGLIFIVLFDTLFGYLRRSLILVATARIDARLSSFIFSRLLNLGIDYFERSQTGVVVRVSFKAESGNIFGIMGRHGFPDDWFLQDGRDCSLIGG